MGFKLKVWVWGFGVRVLVFNIFRVSTLKPQYQTVDTTP